jgi:hypothetical protein
MSLEEKVVLIDSSDTAVNDRARFRIPVMICAGRFCGIKPGVMSLATNDDGQLWTIRTLGRIKLPEGCPNLGNFVLDDNGELTLNRCRIKRCANKIKKSTNFRDTIAVDENPLREISILGSVS